MDRELTLHIGRPKTGSSAVQRFLWDNKDSLLEKGVLYPQQVMHHRASHKLALVFQTYLPAHRVVADQSPKAVYDSMYAEAGAKNANRIIASSENLFLVDPGEIRHLLDPQWKVRVVCYVRRQDHVLASSFVQEVKTGSIDIDTDKRKYVFSRERLAWLDYQRVLAKWENAFGRDSIEVRVYHDGDPGWSIFEDFIEMLDLPLDGLNLPRQRINPSPARDVLDFIRMMNKRNDLRPFTQAHLRIPLLSASEKLGVTGGYDSHSMLDSALRCEVLEYFRLSNQKVAQTYLRNPRDQLFPQGVDSGSKNGVAYPGLDLERFAYMMATVCGAQQAQIDELRRELKKIQAD